MTTFTAPKSYAEFTARHPQYIARWASEHVQDAHAVHERLASEAWHRGLANEPTSRGFFRILNLVLHWKLGLNFDQVAGVVGIDGEYVVISNVFDPAYPLCSCAPSRDQVIPKVA